MQRKKGCFFSLGGFLLRFWESEGFILHFFRQEYPIFQKNRAFFSRASYREDLLSILLTYCIFIYYSIIICSFYCIFCVLDDFGRWDLLNHALFLWRFSFWLRFPFFIDLSFLWIAAHSILSLVYLFLILCFCPSESSFFVIFRPFSCFLPLFRCFLVFSYFLCLTILTYSTTLQHLLFSK